MEELLKSLSYSEDFEKTEENLKKIKEIIDTLKEQVVNNA